MDNQKHDSKFSRFLSGKGFYVALAVCLIGTATAAWIAIDSTQNALLDEPSSRLSSSQISRSSGSSRSSTASSEMSASSRISSQSGSTSSGLTAGSASSKTSSPATSSSGASSVPTIENVPDETVSSAISVDENEGDSQQTAVPVEDIAVDESLFATQEPLAFTMPIDGEVFGVYSQGELVRNVTLNEWRTHDGIDIRADKGTPVRAVADGVVSRVYHDPMWGTVVEITHAGGFTSVTSGLDPAAAVKQGDSVRIEDTIGVVGSILSEISLNDHIHFGMKQDGNWVDPILAMGKAIQ